MAAIGKADLEIQPDYFGFVPLADYHQSVDYKKMFPLSSGI
jgi:hypothetical protein